MLVHVSWLKSWLMLAGQMFEMKVFDKKWYAHLRFNLFDIKYSTVKLWYIRI